MPKKKTVKDVLRPDEYEHLVVTLEGAKEELEEVSREVEWFTSLVPERIEECLEIIGATEVIADV